MNRVYVIAAIIISFSSLAAGQAMVKKSASVSKNEQAIRDLERLYAESVMRQDLSALDRILADDFIATSSRSEMRNKSQEIDDIKPN